MVSGFYACSSSRANQSDSLYLPRVLGRDHTRVVVVRCFQCGKSTPAGELVSVGDGRFCSDCFATLLESSAEAQAGAAPPPLRSPAPPPAGDREAHRNPAPPPALRHSRCLVCEVPLVEKDAVAFLRGALCRACCEQMNSELAQMRGAETQAQRGHEHPSEPVASPKPELAVWTPGSETVTCAGCQRPMPGPGSYRRLGGANYCAACLPFYARLEGEAGAFLSKPPHTKERSDAGSLLEDEDGCDCCGRDLPVDADALRGFRLCTACRTGDLELALLVAKARHRRRLLKLKARHEEESDDHR